MRPHFGSTPQPAGVAFVFLPNQKNAKSQCEEQKAWLQSIAEKVAGKAVPVTVTVADAGPVPRSGVAGLFRYHRRDAAATPARR